MPTASARERPASPSACSPRLPAFDPTAGHQYGAWGGTMSSSELNGGSRLSFHSAPPDSRGHRDLHHIVCGKTRGDVTSATKQHRSALAAIISSDGTAFSCARYPTIGAGSTAPRKTLKTSGTFCCPENYDSTIWKARVDLAACYQILDDMDLNEGICNHLTALVPGTTDKFLVIAYGLLWSEVTASNLLLVNSKGEIVEGEGEIDATAFYIHKALHDAGHQVVLHTHMPKTTALCCTTDFKLHMCHQNCLRFYNDIAYDNVFNGLVTDDKEGTRIAEAMAGKKVFMHVNHGVIVCGPAVATAFDDLYYLERAAEVQILAMSTGKELMLVKDKVAQEFKDTMSAGAADGWAKLHFEALKRRLLKGNRRIFIE